MLLRTNNPNTQIIMKHLFNMLELGSNNMITKEEKLIIEKMTSEQLYVKLSYACISGQLDVVKYLLTSRQYHFLNEQHNSDFIFTQACMYGQLDVVEFLLVSEDIEQHANIHAQDDLGLLWSCHEGFISLLHFLLTSPKLKEHADIHANNDQCFISACINNHTNIVNYLIFDYKIDKNNSIEEKLIAKNLQHVLDIFSKRDLQDKLQNELLFRDKLSLKNKI